MASYNRVILVGNLTQDPELRYLPSGTAMTKLKVAVNRDRANQQGERETDFFNIVVWGRQAETSAEYLSKGRPVLVEGQLQNRSWEGPDGQKRYATDIKADRVVFLGSRDRSDGGAYNGGYNGGGDFGSGQGSPARGGNGVHDEFGDMPMEDNILPETDDEIAF
jgi:single-strand DNA-binding protein